MLSFVLALFIRNLFVIGDSDFLIDTEYYGFLFLFIMLIWTILLSFRRDVPVLPNKSFKEVVYDVVKTVAAGTIFLLSITFLIKGFIVSRLFVMMFAVLNILFLVIERRFYQIYKIEKFRRGEGLSHIIVIGRGVQFEQIVRLINSHGDWGIKLVEAKNIDSFSDADANRIKAMHIDLIVFSGEKTDIEMMEKYMNAFTESGIKTMVNIGGIFNFNKNSFMSSQAMLGFDFLEFSLTNEEPVLIYMKYLFDKIFSAVLIFLFLPLYAVICLVILLFMGRPVFFVQKRIGLNGKTFNMYKFRTMINGAEEMKEKLQEKNEMSGPVFKIVKDPRITKIGKFLRKYSIDETPQFFNIFKGEMSFVGPRPPLLKEVAEYEFWHRRRLSMKPGLTCLWQISGRNEIDFTDWMYKDLEYIDKWSLVYDFMILIKTIPIILRGRGI